MPRILLSTFIAAPRERVFDLARSIDAHVQSTRGTSERAVAGVTHGLIDVGQSVTWEARHLGVKQRLTVRITELKRSEYFEDQMVSGAFKRMRHRHEFRPCSGGTDMIDDFEFEAPLSVLGYLAEAIFLTSYLRRFLVSRAAELKRIAESDEWRVFLRTD